MAGFDQAELQGPLEPIEREPSPARPPEILLGRSRISKQAKRAWLADDVHDALVTLLDDGNSSAEGSELGPDESSQPSQIA